jgi:hypothetical protein
LNRFLSAVLFLLIVSCLLSSSYSTSAKQSATAKATLIGLPPEISIISPTTASPACARQYAVFIPGVTVQVVFNYTEIEPLNLTIEIYNATVIAAGVAQVAGITPGVNITQAVNVTIWNLSPTFLEAPDGIYDLSVTMFDINNQSATATQSKAVILDRTSPVIWNQMRTPSGNVTANQPVTISANVTDLLSGVGSVRLVYNVTNSPLTLDFPMSLNSTTGLYECPIPGQPASATVKYKITAYDNAGNVATDDNAGQYYTYVVNIPEFSSLLVLPLLMLATLVASTAYRKNRKGKSLRG